MKVFEMCVEYVVYIVGGFLLSKWVYLCLESYVSLDCVITSIDEGMISKVRCKSDDNNYHLPFARWNLLATLYNANIINW
jgi:hypothetical protein